jgi:hypothetical protein
MSESAAVLGMTTPGNTKLPALSAFAGPAWLAAGLSREAGLLAAVNTAERRLRRSAATAR